MGYVTLLLHEAELIEGGMYVDQGTEQCRDMTAAMPVTLHQEDLKRGTFVVALHTLQGHMVPFTWTYDGGDHRAVITSGCQAGGTLEQFLYKRAEHAAKAIHNGWAPEVVEHTPRQDD
jgi:hypothetical protein